MSDEKRIFIDSNVLVYLLSKDERKAEIAEGLLHESAVMRIISTQVINEFVNTARKKAGLDWDEIRESINVICDACRVEEVSLEDQEHAIDIAERYQYQWYDSLIISTALKSGAAVLASEDMQDGQRISEMLISNPFKE